MYYHPELINMSVLLTLVIMDEQHFVKNQRNVKLEKFNNNFTEDLDIIPSKR